VDDPERPDEILRCGRIELNVDRWTVMLEGKALHVTPIECRLLKAFLRAKGRLLTYDMLSDLVWGQDYNPMSRTISTHVSHFKRKLGAERHRIVSIKTVGYRMDLD
jgi:two-component system response regulator RegX3